MGKFFQFHSGLHSFRLFSLEHLLTITIIVILCIVLIVFRKSLQKNERFWRFTLAFVLLYTDISHHLWLVAVDSWSIKHDLPLQLSDLAVIFAIIMLFSKNEKLFHFLFFAGMASSVQAILTPDLGRFSFPHFQYFEFFISHGGTVLACLLMIAVVSYFKVSIRSLWLTVFLVNLYAVLVYFLNKAIRANYLYIMRKPGTKSLLDYLGIWPWYLLSMEFVMIISFFILYWLFSKLRKTRTF